MRTYDLQQEDAAKTSEFFHFDAVDRLTCSTFAACRPGDLSCYGGPPSPGVVRPVADVRPQPDAGFAPSIAPAQGKSARDRSARGSPPRAPEACLVPSIWCPAGKSITWAIVRCATTAGGSPPRGTRLAWRARRQVSDIFARGLGEAIRFYSKIDRAAAHLSDTRSVTSRQVPARHSAGQGDPLPRGILARP
jgi:hypothetical protein